LGRFHYHGPRTHLGEWLGIAPTGRQLIYGGVNVDKVVEGKMVEHGGAANLLGPLLEVGAVEVVSLLKREAA
jgi:hypothetical protein